MPKLDLQSWVSSAKIATAIVAVFSLLYIGRELDQNARATQNASWFGINALMVELDTTEATDPELNHFFRAAESTPKKVGPEDFWKSNGDAVYHPDFVGYINRVSESCADPGSTE